jgi:glycosyltransferase involved in cell wall biosynthesis
MGSRVLMLAVGDERAASTRHRVLAHRPALEAAGLAVEIRHPLRGRSALVPRRLCRAADLARDLLGPHRADLLFVQRKTYPPALAPALARFPGPRVFDMDDAIDLPPPARHGGPRAARRYRRNFEATVERMNLVLCGNRELAARLPHDRFELLPTAIDTRRFRPAEREPASGPVLGWVGHSDNLPYLERLAGVLRELARRRPGTRLVVVADRPPRLPGIEVEFRRWRLEEEVSCFGGIAIGLMPLADDPWTRGKCAFKAIQYMALGIPTVASPVGMNREVIRDGETGFLPADEPAWVAALERLLAEPALAARIGAAGRRTIEERYALDVVSRRLITILRERLAVRA